MSPKRKRARRGATLLELIVVVAILGLTSSIAVLAFRQTPKPDPTDPATIIADTLERVLATGAPVTLQLTVDARPALATINPDGSIVADSALMMDRLTGRPTR